MLIYLPQQLFAPCTKTEIPATIVETFFGLNQHDEDTVRCEENPIDRGQYRPS
ncbi:hypothetical protein AF72_03695 [Xylella taiwanensis]|uniref:Uncharacterized protein n=1 Tax=Xylella taiwanensis TaxID=1444770 RepID=Z9JL19_9GAMM|nr:hypothetical protein AF72_03695 [Xylella taiwanensis]